MASAARELGRLNRADPVPETVAGLVAYTGSREAAVRALTGMAGTPRRGDYRSAEQYEAARRSWRSASRRVQRHTTTTASERRGTAGKPVQLTPTQRRRAQTANRTVKQRATRGRGIRAQVTGEVRANSPGDRRTKRRTIAPEKGVEIRPGYVQRALAARAAGDHEEAQRQLLRGFLAGARMPPTTTVTGASWTLWPDDGAGVVGRWDQYDEDAGDDEDAGEL